LANECNADEYGCTPMYIAAYQGHESVVRVLAGECGADVNQAKNDGQTPIFIASECGHESVVKVLAGELGADVNQAASNGNTPIYIAAANRYKGIVHLLVLNGATCCSKSRRFFTFPFYITAQDALRQRAILTIDPIIRSELLNVLCESVLCTIITEYATVHVNNWLLNK
jgi:ankyrin repeat protein